MKSSGGKSTTTVINRETGKSTTRESEPIGTKGGPIIKLFGELSGDGIFTIKGEPSKIYKKLAEQTTPEGSTASWVDDSAKGKPSPTFVHIGDDIEVQIPTM